MVSSNIWQKQEASAMERQRQSWVKIRAIRTKLSPGRKEIRWRAGGEHVSADPERLGLTGGPRSRKEVKLDHLSSSSSKRQGCLPWQPCSPPHPKCPEIAIRSAFQPAFSHEKYLPIYWKMGELRTLKRGLKTLMSEETLDMNEFNQFHH